MVVVIRRSKSKTTTLATELRADYVVAAFALLLGAPAVFRGRPHRRISQQCQSNDLPVSVQNEGSWGSTYPYRLSRAYVLTRLGLILFGIAPPLRSAGFRLRRSISSTSAQTEIWYRDREFGLERVDVVQKQMRRHAWTWGAVCKAATRIRGERYDADAPDGYFDRTIGLAPFPEGSCDKYVSAQWIRRQHVAPWDHVTADERMRHLGA